MMKTIYHAANSRGHANRGWLKSNHTFSFANYYNRDRMHFGVLRVLNDDHVDGVWIHQDAWFHLARFDKDVSRVYSVRKPGNGVYIFVIKEEAQVGGQLLHERDGYGIWDTDSFTLEAVEDAEILLMEIPMELPQH